MVYKSSYPEPRISPSEIVLIALREPLDAQPLKEALKKRRPGDVVIVVSDMTRPIPYSEFLGAMIAEIEAAGVSSQEIVILIATGMHRSSTQEERHRMFGTDICKRYRILDHRADEDSELLTLDTRSTPGAGRTFLKTFGLEPNSGKTSGNSRCKHAY